MTAAWALWFQQLRNLIASGTTPGSGSSWLTGTGVPSPSLGVDGDLYLNDSNGDVYQKISGSWHLVANIEGPQGPAGPSGPTIPPTGNANQVYATPDGVPGAATLRSLIAADLPIATTAHVGAVKPDGTTITIAGDGTISSSGGGGTPGGSSGQIQYNNAGAFGGFTASGDATVNTSTGAVTLAVAGTAGTYTKVTTDTKGRVISGTTLSGADIPLLGIGFVINNGSTGTNTGPELAAPRAGSVSKCVIVTKASDAVTDLTFKIKKNGTNVFSSDPTITHGTSPGTVTTVTTLTSVPLSVAANDVFTIDITSGTSTWQFTAQLEP
jgi:hypothetical protein